jgi:CheY-like chemotaxis protein
LGPGDPGDAMRRRSHLLGPVAIAEPPPTVVRGLLAVCGRARGPLTLVAGTALLLVTGILALARAIARRVPLPIHSLRQAPGELSDGSAPGPPALPAPPTTEVDDIAAAMATARRLLDRQVASLQQALDRLPDLAELRGSQREERRETGSAGERPVSPAPRPDPAAGPPPADSRDARPLTVVIVEDNADAQDMLRMLLELQGHHVAVAGDGEGGAARIVALDPDMAFVDVGLPDLDGYQVAARVRSRGASSVFLVALTGYGQPEDRWRALAAGFDEHAVKPLDPAALGGLLARAARHDGRSR